MNPPRCSGRQRQPTIWPDNVYRDEAPIDILRHYDAFDVTGLPADQSPDCGEGPSSGGVSTALVPTGNSIEANTVAQKTAPMYAYYIKTHVLLNADMI